MDRNFSSSCPFGVVRGARSRRFAVVVCCSEATPPDAAMPPPRQ